LNATIASSHTPQFEEATYQKLFWRLIPFLFLLYIIAFLDRVNVSFAKLQMGQDLGFSESVYALGAGIFFIGYFLFEVPSNLILNRVGAKLWIARIMILWGIISAAFMYVREISEWLGVETATGFNILRFLLGVGEAGFFPGIILYLTYWFPAEYRARMVARFMTAIAIAGVIGSPLSGAIMEYMNGLNGWAGWQWLFLLEGIPAVLAGFAVLYYLDNGPNDAKWLNDQERATVVHRLEQDNKKKMDVGGHHNFGACLKDYKVWVLALMYFSEVVGFYGVTFFLPQLVKEMGVTSEFKNGMVSAIPWLFAAIAMVWNGQHSDKTMERRWHVAIPALIAALGLIITALAGKQQPVISMIGLTMTCAGCLCVVSCFWSLPTAFLTGSAAAGGIALINSFGNLGGYYGPKWIGAIKDKLGDPANALYILAAFLVLCAVLAVTVFKPTQIAATPEMKHA
jgi:MFS family permease